VGSGGVLESSRLAMMQAASSRNNPMCGRILVPPLAV
jgi:hypothetical protein